MSEFYANNHRTAVSRASHGMSRRSFCALALTGAALCCAACSKEADDEYSADTEPAPDMPIISDTLEATDEVASTLIERTTDSGISYGGYTDLEGSDALAALEEILAQYQSLGLTISIVVRDLEDDALQDDASEGETLESTSSESDTTEADSAENAASEENSPETNPYIYYQQNDTAYSASAIKGPYCLFIYESLVETGTISRSSVYSTIASTINYSDNDAYRSLRSTTYMCGWSDWLKEAGVEMDDSRASYFDQRWYADVSAEDLAAAWTRGYAYLTSGSDYATELGELFETTVNSPIHTVLQDTYTVWSKAGWYDAISGNASYATNDAGIVFSDTGPYVIAVVTNANCNFTLLEQVVDALNRCHGGLTGGSTESLR